ncbi:hypothetical protein [uncultured Thalassolituus sp.]|uniref:hypothetical protein n=1 Tax=uncultured Thalassolituus sp. TaxID=285273 RepID=UPI002615C2CB|nr:hypothetical protein [uncultured Thalassolituus sp.]
MKPLLQIFLLLFPLLSHAAPLLTPNLAHEALQREYIGQRLYWTPFRLPLTVRQGEESREGQTLDSLYSAGLVTREREITTEEIGTGRRRVVMNWTYEWADKAHEGAYYGMRQVLEVDSVSDVVQQGERWFAEVRLRWYVSDLPSWLSDPVLRQARTLRRSMESKQRPFEAALTLEYRNQRWEIWVPELY